MLDQGNLLGFREKFSRSIHRAELTFLLLYAMILIGKYLVNPVIVREAISVVAGSHRLQPAQNLSLRLCAP